LAALENIDGAKLAKSWGWLSKYLKMEPGFFRFNVKLNDALKTCSPANLKPVAPAFSP
jgi:hypothetical protein